MKKIDWIRADILSEVTCSGVLHGRRTPVLWLVFFVLVMCISLQATAAEKAPVDPRVESIEVALANVETRRSEIADLEVRVARSEGTAKQILQARLALAWSNLLEDGLKFAEEVVAQKEAGEVIGEFEEAAAEVLSSQKAVAQKAIELLERNLKPPADDLSAAEGAAAYTNSFRAIEGLDRVLATELRGIELARGLELDVDAQATTLRTVLENRAENISVLLEAASRKVAGLQAGVEVLPTDEELGARLKVAENRVSGMAAVLENTIGLMERMELDATQYRAQVLQATGDITTDILKPAVILGLLSDWWGTALTGLAESAPGLLFNVFLFLLIVFIARKLARIAERLVEHSLTKSQLSFSKLLERMIVSIVRNTVMILGILVALSQVGITLGPVLAGLGVAGFVIGFALQDSLSNFASGMMILLYRPFDVGELVEAGGVFGTVHQMSLVNTTILTLDNQTIVVPNNKIWGDVIRNVTNQSTRRVDITFSVSYTDDIPKTERILAEIVNSHELILKEPEALIRLHELGDSSVNFIVRAWSKTENYWDVYWDLMRSVKLRFDEECISIPFPQRDVHLYAQTPVFSAPGTVPESEVGSPVFSRTQVMDVDE